VQNPNWNPFRTVRSEVQLGKTRINVNSLTGVQVSGIITGMILIIGGDETNPRLQNEDKIAVTCSTAINLRNLVEEYKETNLLPNFQLK
jgi:hypothetical protein